MSKNNKELKSINMDDGKPTFRRACQIFQNFNLGNLNLGNLNLEILNLENFNFGTFNLENFNFGNLI